MSKIGHFFHEIGAGIKDSVKAIGQGVEAVGDGVTGHEKKAVNHLKHMGEDDLGALGAVTDTAFTGIGAAAEASPVGLVLDHTKPGKAVMDLRSKVGGVADHFVTDAIKYSPSGLLNDAARHGYFGHGTEEGADAIDGLTKSMVGDPLHQALTSKNVGDVAESSAELASFAIPGGGEVDALRGVSAVDKAGEVTGAAGAAGAEGAAGAAEVNRIWAKGKMREMTLDEEKFARQQYATDPEGLQAFGAASPAERAEIMKSTAVPNKLSAENEDPSAIISARQNQALYIKDA